MTKNRILALLIFVSQTSLAQVFSTPGGSVGNNGTTDQVYVTGSTKLVNPTGRTLTIERDNEDSWLTFHDPNDYWYSLGIDRSNNGNFTMNSGGSLGAANHFVMNSSGWVGLGTTSPLSKLHINSSIERETFRIYKQGNAANYLSFWQGTGAGAIDPIGTGALYLGYDQPTNVFMGITGAAVNIGNVGIGTTTPDAKLAVKGQIHAQEVKVDLNGAIAPDYVFANNYQPWTTSKPTSSKTNICPKFPPPKKWKRME